MNLTITGRHLELSDTLKKDIETKVKQFKKYFTHIINVHVVISHQKERYLTEIILLAKKLTCTAKEENSDLHFCLNKAIAKIESQLSHLKDKIKTEKHESRRI